MKKLTMKHRLAAALAAASIICGGAAAAPASTDPSPGDRILSEAFLGPVPFGFADWRALFAEQERLNAAAYRLMAHRHADEQLSGIVASPGERRLQVYWKGEMRESTRRLLGELRASVPVQVEPARFSRAELLAAGARILSLDEVSGVTARIDGSGIDIEFDRSRGAGRSTSETLALAARMAPGMRFDLRLQEPGLANARNAMTLPGYAGGFIKSDKLEQPCSLGLPVLRTASGKYGWLTAAHCTSPDVGDRIFNGSLLLGEVVSKLRTIDTSVISANRAEDVARRIFVGGPAGENAAIPIYTSREAVTGNIVYSSGAALGLTGPLVVGKPSTRDVLPTTVCFGQSSTTAATDCVTVPGFTIVDIFLTTPLYGGAATVPGESGGAVFSFHTDGRAIARGVASGYDSPIVSCPAGHRAQKGERCRGTMSFVRIQSIMSNLKVSVLTSNWPSN
jgi:hypothetical protein